MAPGNLYVTWTIDWQDNYLWEGADFPAVSQAINACAQTWLGGRVTWLAEVDDLTDITRYDGIEALIADIETRGEVGLHVHHTSVAPEVRAACFRHAVERVRAVGGSATTYAAGMGNYLSSDTDALSALGVVAQRSYTGNYVNGTLPPLDWFPPDKRDAVARLFPPATLARIPDPRQNPAACDWRGAPDRAGFVDPADYRSLTEDGSLFAVPLGVMNGNEDGLHQLHVQPEISFDRLKAIMDAYARRAGHEPIMVACYFHPYDLTERGSRLTPRMTDRWRALVEYQASAGWEFVTLTQARALYLALKSRKGVTYG